MICDKNHMYTKASIFTQLELSSDEGHKAFGTIGGPVHCWPISGIFDLYRGGPWLRYYEWTIEQELEGQQAVSVLCSDQALEMPRHCLMISIFTRCLQVWFPSSQTPEDLFHLHTFPVCHFESVGSLILSLPVARYRSLHFPDTTTISF